MLFYQILIIITTLSNLVLTFYAFKLRIRKCVKDKIMDVIQEGIITIDESGIVIDINSTINTFIMDITEHNLDICGRNMDLILSKWPRWLLACKSMQTDEFEIDMSDFGKAKYYLVKVYPLYRKNYIKSGTVSVLVDITERKIKENETLTIEEYNREQLKELAIELSTQKKQLESIFDNMSDYCVVVNSAGEYIKQNKIAKRLIPSIQINKTGDWLKGARFYDISGNEIMADSVPARRVINGEKLINYRLIMKNDTQELHFNVNADPIYNDNNEFLFGIVVSSDITELVQQQQKIIHQNEQLLTIINTISDMAILSITDKDGNFIHFSNAADIYFPEKAFHAKAGDTYRKGMYFYPDGNEIELCDMPAKKVLQGEKVTNFHFIKKEIKGETHFLVNGTPIYDRNGNLINCVFFNMDITEQVLHKKLIPVTEQLASLNSLKDKLFTIFTHDIRSPLATMVSLIELLEREKQNIDDDSIEIINTVKQQILNTFNIVENLLEWLRSQREGLIRNPSFHELYLIIQEAIEMYSISAGIKEITITSEVVEGISVYVDKEAIIIVLRNLISNAIKFTGNGGVITIQAFEAEKDIIVAINDNGNGMKDEKVQTLFREAYASSTLGTAGERGIGLGLLICKELVTLNGGKIWADSIQGKGSTFYFSLLKSNKSLINF